MADDGTNYDYSYIADDGIGNVKIYSSLNGKIVPLMVIGTVDYINGIIQINNLTVSNYSNYISLYVKTVDSDLYAKNDKIIIIDSTDVSINVTTVKN